MMLKAKDTWQLQEAKNRLSEVVRAAQDRGPQTITVRGKDAVVVMSADDYAREHPRIEQPKESLGEFFAKWRGIFAEFGEDFEFPSLRRDYGRPRDVDIGE